MSSHKEAPSIANDAAADNTDVYAFVSPDAPDTVTLIANFVPLQNPAGGPNFYEFGDDVLYEIHIDNNGDAAPDITYQFTFTTTFQDVKTFLYNTGPITSLTSPAFNRRQFVTVKRVVAGVATTLGTDLACPPCNVGPASTPDYASLAAAAVHSLGGARKVFAGQRAEGFYVDLGAIFDLGILRPFLPDFLEKMPAAPGINATKYVNINTIAIQVPKTDLTLGGVPPTDPTLQTSTIGVYASASRQQSRMYRNDGTQVDAGPYVQVSRQANPLINEVIIAIPMKDKFNASAPAGDKQFAARFAHPELAALLPVLYPGVFPNLAKLDKAGTARADIEAILLTGIPAGLIPGFQNYTGSTQADLLRLNMAYAPAAKPSNLGLLGNDVAGFPNGRRVFDDVTSIELRALAGAVYGLIDPKYKPDAAVGELTEGLTSSNTDVTADNTVHYQSDFPYLGLPHSGYYTPDSNTPASDLGAINQPPKQIIVPVGPPQTGIGPKADNGTNTAIWAGGAAALAGAAIAAGAARRRPVAVGVEGASDPGAESDGPADQS